MNLVTSNAQRGFALQLYVSVLALIGGCRAEFSDSPAPCLAGAQVDCPCDGAGAGQLTCEQVDAGLCAGVCDEPPPTRFVLGGELSREFAAAGQLQLPGGSFCGATLVAPDRILTAAHCLYGVQPSAAYFLLGLSDRTPVHRIALRSILVHPEYRPLADRESIRFGRDLAVGWLAESIEDVLPATLYLGQAEVLRGHAMHITGYGAWSIDPVSGRGLGKGVRRSATVIISELSEQGLHYDFMGMGSCAGDSGGPGFVRFPDGFAQVGVTSYGDRSCSLYGVYQRLDTAVGFLAQAGLTASPRPMNCAQDFVCDGQCQIDSDCLSLL